MRSVNEGPDPEVRTLEVTGEMDRHAAEALRLEILRLAKVTGIELGQIRIQKAAPER